jgi:hypothetical protein
MQKNQPLSAISDRLLQQPMCIASAHIVVGESIFINDGQIRVHWGKNPLRQTLLTIRRVFAEQQCMACFEKYHPTPRGSLMSALRERGRENHSWGGILP